MLTKLEGVGKAGGGGESWKGWGKLEGVGKASLLRTL